MARGGGSNKKNKNQQQPPSKQKHRPVYESDGDSDGSDAGPPAAIPLKSLEQGKVRDLVAEFEREQAIQRQNNKPASKRARAELQQLEIDKQKKKFRTERAEKVVWRKFDRENRVFETYYKRQLQLSGPKHEGEWKEFMDALRAPMAVHVRVNGNYKSLSEIVTGTLELDFPMENVLVKRALSNDGDDVEAPVSLGPVEWADDKRTWKLSIDSKSLRKEDKLRELSSYLQTQSHLGTLQRLDPVTAILPALLRVEPGQRVLDLCGGGEHRAPGIIERLDAQSDDDDDDDEDGSTTNASNSVLVVNERDAASAARAVQSLGRTLALSRATLVTAHKPMEFPAPVESATDGGVFDRVVCAVPCSGDGLARKIPERWRTWTPEAGLKTHASQVAMATKAMALVRVGGALLYCTRSLNPIENEAVIAQLLRAGGDAGAYELVDLSEDCPALVRARGLSTWNVMDEQMQVVETWDSATPAQRKQLRASMWPPTVTEAKATKFHLERCVRVLPHHNDTNAVFFALIRKVREPTTAVAGPAVVPAELLTKPSRHKKQLKNVRKVLGSLSPLSDKERRQLVAFYDFDDDVLTAQQVMERSGFAKDSAIHVVSPQISWLLQSAFPGRLSVHRAGVEAFKKVASSAHAPFELTDDGARELLPVLGGRVLPLPMDEFTLLLAKREMWLKNASDSARELLSETTEGSLVVVLDDMEPMQTADRDLVLVAIKRHSSYSLVSTSAATARVKSLMKELDAGGDGDDDGYDSLELDDE